MFILFLLILILIILSGQYFGSGEKPDWQWRKANKKIDTTINFEPLYSRQILKESAGEKFFGRHYREMLALKLGQRKLFFSELEFYSLFLEKTVVTKPIKVIYAGAAIGSHSTLIAELFSNLTPFREHTDIEFHYYDMTAFSEDLYKYSNMYLHHKYFTNEDAAYWVSRSFHILFISDVRTCEDEDCVERDMAMQREWVEIMKPDACMLKFRLRWEPPGKTRYFDGEIYTQPRIGPSSTETRLIFFPNEKNKYNERDWDTETYNNQLFYYQRHNRLAFHEFNLYTNPASEIEQKKNRDIFQELSFGIKGLCHCHDCWSEIEICKRFFKFELKIPDIIKLMNLVEIHAKSTIDVAPHNLLVEERDINKKIIMLEKLAIKNAHDITDKFYENKKKKLII